MSLLEDFSPTRQSDDMHCLAIHQITMLSALALPFIFCVRHNLEVAFALAYRRTFARNDTRGWLQLLLFSDESSQRMLGS